MAATRSRQLPSPSTEFGPTRFSGECRRPWAGDDPKIRPGRSQDFYFDSDSIRLRATFRFGAKIADVERVVKLAVTDLGSR
jgi:hypothetical protein